MLYLRLDGTGDVADDLIRYLENLANMAIELVRPGLAARDRIGQRGMNAHLISA